MQKLNREILELADVRIQMDVTNIYRLFHLNTKENTFLSAFPGLFSKTGDILGYKASLNRHKNIKITPCIL